MIKLHTDKSYKELYVHLLKLLVANNSVFQKTWIVVPNHSAKQWLQKSLAKSLGVCAQIKFIMPSSFNWEILKNVAGSNTRINIFSSDVLRWQIYQLLSDSTEFKALKKVSAIENFNLAEKIAQTLLKYNDERPELINDWDNGLFTLKQEQEWQADLWVKLLSSLCEQSPVQLLQKFNPATDFKQNPSKIILFATEQLTTLQQETILKLAQHRDIQLLITNPSPQKYWFDLKPEAATARNKLFNPELAYLNNVGNPLLANLGYNKMAIFDAFLNHDIDLTISNLRINNPKNSLLASIKQDIADLVDNSSANLVNDNTIQIHSCHNRLREVEIIKDKVLYLLDEDASLNPEDIIVVAPDINDYVANIKDVFNHENNTEAVYIPFHIDRMQLADNNYITTLMGLLKSFAGEMTAPVIYELLSQQVILDQFNLSEDDLPRIKTWIIDSNIRNFYSAAQKGELGFEAKIGNTWNFGENRWLAGYIAGDVDDTAYLSTFGDASGQEPLFAQCFDFLKLWYQAYKNSRDNQSPQQWFIFIKDLCNNFLYNDFETDFAKQISLQLETKFIQQTLNCQVKIPLTIINTIVESVITANNYRSEGQIGIRFQSWENSFITEAKVLIIMGLNENEFPKKEIKNDLDIFNNIAPRLNKSTYQRDKNLMLSALTENVEHLIMTYIGFNPKTNDPQPPSVILADIISYLQVKTSNTFKVQYHKMYGYNKIYFSDKNHSYSHKHYQLAQSYYNKDKLVEDAAIHLNLPQEKHITLKDLSKFFIDPLDFFLKTRAKISHPIYSTIIQDTETYFPNGLESWSLKHKIFLHGSISAAKTGIISDNKSGQLTLKKYDDELRVLYDYTKNLTLQTHIIEPRIADFKIFANIEINTKQQLISVYPNKITTKDLCKHWIKHLCYQSKSPSIACFEDKKVIFLPLENYVEELSKILAKWQASFSEPWLFCPKSMLKIKTTNLTTQTRKEYLKQFTATDRTFPSEGQKYFIQQVEKHAEQIDIESFILPLINSIESFDEYI
ncbi:hypothetical protein MNBD_GAMMA01-1195 [hydrothermal vent metagenome]|uniref:RecC C-terminal domain-containing protein n=1 Tax=hydrothermal vent metagenome TaxID=652676 RepID=A0A3B0VJ79_9ZZZZ